MKMKVTKEQIRDIRRLKDNKISITDISRQLNLPVSTVQYYYDDKYKQKALERAKKWQSENKQYRDKESYRKYQRKYHARRYSEDKEFREKVKERNRILWQSKNNSK